MTREGLSLVGSDTDDLAELYRVLSVRGLLAGYAATERFYEIGTPESLQETAGFLRAQAGRSARGA